MQNNDLLNLNKIIVSNLNNDFNIFKMDLLKGNETKNDFKNQKINSFNLELEKQKKNMDEILILKKPEEIDFSDKKLDDKPIDINNMNNMLEEMEKERNILLNNNKLNNNELINNELNNNELNNNELNNNN